MMQERQTGKRNVQDQQKEKGKQEDQKEQKEGRKRRRKGVIEGTRAEEEVNKMVRRERKMNRCKRMWTGRKRRGGTKRGAIGGRLREEETGGNV